MLFCCISKVKTWHHFTSVFWSFVLIKNYGQDIDHHCMPHGGVGTHKYVPNSQQARNVISHTCKRVKRFVFEWWSWEKPCYKTKACSSDLEFPILSKKVWNKIRPINVASLFFESVRVIPGLSFSAQCANDLGNLCYGVQVHQG